MLDRGFIAERRGGRVSERRKSGIFTAAIILAVVIALLTLFINPLIAAIVIPLIVLAAFWFQYYDKLKKSKKWQNFQK